MYSKKKDTASQVNHKTAPPPLETCQNSGCDNKTVVSFMRVFNKNSGKSIIDCFSSHNKGSAFGYTSNREIIMNEQYDFLGWVTRCADCYSLDLKGQGKRAVDYCHEQAAIRSRLQSSIDKGSE